MQRINWFKFLIISSVFTLLVSGCTKDKEKIDDGEIIDLEKNYLFTGQVIDQLTRVPVSGVTIRLGCRMSHEPYEMIAKQSYYTVSVENGKFSLVVPELLFNDRLRNPWPAIFAEDTKYIGSNYVNAEQGQENISLELFTSSQLNLHVKNDTLINKIDETKVWIVGDSGFGSYPGFIGKVSIFYGPQIVFACKGRDFDTVFVIKQLWSNINYSVGGGPSYFLGPKYIFSTSVKLRPDTINYFSVSF